jgi:hypothetical protein
MDEFSPASLSTESATESDTDLEDDDRRPTTGYRVVLRVLNGCTHGVACVLLVAIMAGFLRDMGGTWYRIMRYVFYPAEVGYEPILAVGEKCRSGESLGLTESWHRAVPKPLP